MTVDVAGLRARGQALAGQLQVSAGTLTRPAVGRTLDPATGVTTPDAPTVLYTGQARVRVAGQAEQQLVFGDVNVTRQRWLVNLPATVVDVRVGDVWQVTSDLDQHLVGMAFRVIAVSARTVSMYRQLGVEEVR